MTDDLLDEATRLAGAGYVSVDAADMIRVLVERVRVAEAERQEWADLWQKASMSVLTLQGDAKTLTRERDAARGKLDKVREYIRRHDETAEMGREQWGADVLDILDDKETT